MNYLVLILTLPTENATARMRAWRGLKATGAAVLRDGVYLIPDGDARRVALAAVADDVEAAGGTAYLLDVAAADYPFAALFDRTAEFGKLADDAAALAAAIEPGRLPELGRQARKLRKALDALAAIDFFPGDASRHAAAVLAALEQRLKAAAGGDEPNAVAADVPRLSLADFQGRRWATRQRPWVDRLASAWLIQRFIDPAARFVWIASPQDCPADALGFDFDGAAFTHVGERVSFETLLASFGLDADPGLMRFARIVHFLDVGGLPVAEAAGLEALLAGMHTAIEDDDALLAAAAASFDYLLAALRKSL